MDPKELLDIIYEYKKIRENHEPIGYLSRRAYEGNHFVRWNKELQKIVSDAPVRKINALPEIATQVDQFQNFLLSTNFIFTVVPKLLSDDQGVNASMYLSLLARDDYERLRMNNKIAQLIKYALFDNVSFAEVSLNENGDDADVKIWDMFEILFDPTIRDWSKQKLVVKVIRKKINDLKNSKLYTLPKNYSSGETFFSWKDVYMAEKYSSFTQLRKDEILLFECFLRTPNGLKIITIDGAKNIYRNDDYPDIKTIPIHPFAIYSGDLYQPSFAYRLIPVNRTIDLIAHRIGDLILRLSKGGWLVQEEENLDAQMNEEIGQIVRYTTTKPEQIQIQNIPPFILQWFTMMFNLAERYTISPVIAGNLPQKASGVRAAKLIETMVSQAYQNNSSVVENLRNVITGILSDIFLFRYHVWKVPKEFYISDLPKKLSKVSFISAKYADIHSGENVVKIPAEYERFNIEIDNARGYTLEEQKNTAIKLAELGLIGKETLKRIFKLGSTGYLLEAEEKMAIETKDFQQLIAQFPNMTPEQKQAVITVLRMMGQIAGGGAPVQSLPNETSQSPPSPNSSSLTPPTPPPQEAAVSPVEQALPVENK